MLLKHALKVARGSMCKSTWAISAALAMDTRDHSDGRCRSAGPEEVLPSHVGSEMLAPFDHHDLPPVKAPWQVCREVG